MLAVYVESASKYTSLSWKSQDRQVMPALEHKQQYAQPITKCMKTLLVRTSHAKFGGSILQGQLQMSFGTAGSSIISAGYTLPDEPAGTREDCPPESMKSVSKADPPDTLQQSCRALLKLS